MYCYSIEDHELDVEDITALTGKVSSLLNLKLQIETASEIDTNELADIEICVDLVCQGTDMRREDIMVSDGVTVSFEDDGNVIVQFIAALLAKVKAMVDKLKNWFKSLTDRKNLLDKQIIIVEAMNTQQYAKSDAVSNIIIKKGIASFTMRKETIVNTKQLFKYVGAGTVVIDALEKRVFSKLFDASKKIYEGMEVNGKGIPALMSEQQLAIGDDAVTRIKNVDADLNQINVVIQSFPDSFKSQDSSSGAELTNTGPMLGNKVITCRYQRPAGDSNTDHFVAINRFKLHLTTPEDQVNADFKEISMLRWTNAQCADAVDHVKSLRDGLVKVSDIMRKSIAEVESFNKLVESLKASLQRATEDQADTAKRAAIQKQMISAMNTFNSVYSTLPEHLYEHLITQAFNVLNVTKRHIKNVANVE